MIIKETNIKDLVIIETKQIQDLRGTFTRVFCRSEFSGFLKNEIVQINHSVNKLKGTIRGLHFQKEPYTEERIIRCVKGSIFDVAIDLRKSSSTFLKYFSIILSAEKWNMIFIPKGFAHGYQTLEDNTELIYLHTSFYMPSYEGGFNPFDKTINIIWPIETNIISEKDVSLPFIKKDFFGL